MECVRCTGTVHTYSPDYLRLPNICGLCANCSYGNRTIFVYPSLTEMKVRADYGNTAPVTQVLNSTFNSKYVLN